MRQTSMLLRTANVRCNILRYHWRLPAAQSLRWLSRVAWYATRISSSAATSAEHRRVLNEDGRLTGAPTRLTTWVTAGTLDFGRGWQVRCSARLACSGCSYHLPQLATTCLNTCTLCSSRECLAGSPLFLYNLTNGASAWLFQHILDNRLGCFVRPQGA
jgi:hypothetical protein